MTTLLNTQMIYKIFIKILNDTIQIKNAKKLIGFDDIIADMLINKKINPIVTELFIKGRKLNIIIQYQYILWGHWDILSLKVLIIKLMKFIVFSLFKKL